MCVSGGHHEGSEWVSGGHKEDIVWTAGAHQALERIKRINSTATDLMTRTEEEIHHR